MRFVEGVLGLEKHVQKDARGMDQDAGVSWGETRGMPGELKGAREGAQGLRAGLGGWRNGCREGGAHGRGAPVRHPGETDTWRLGGVGDKQGCEGGEGAWVGAGCQIKQIKIQDSLLNLNFR